MQNWRSPELGHAGVLAPGRWRRLRAAGWLVLLFVVVSLLLYPGLFPLPGDRLAQRAVGCVLAYLAYAAAVRWGERRSPSEIALGPLPRELALGLAIGAANFLLVFAILRLIGAYSLERGAWTDWPADIGWAVVIGFGEELLLRLVVFRLLMRAAGLRAALILSALLFGLLHLANPNATLAAAVAISLESGLMLAAFYLLTGRVWMAVGVHIAWNFVQGPIFGARVSGVVERGSLFTSAPDPAVPALVTGGPFGPEASLPSMIVGVAIFAALMREVARQRRRGT